MRSIVVLAVALASALAEVDATTEGGMVQVAQSRVVNGALTSIDQFPYIVSMQYYGAHRCGGSIITTNRILTAAHCTVNIAANTLAIRAGSTNSQSGGELVAVVEYTNHQSFNPTTLENDISIMFLDTRLVTSLQISVIPLPMQNATIPVGIIADVAGWGALCEKCPGASTLQYVGLPILSNEDCGSMYGESIFPGMLCAGFVEGGRDACQGDSGGPLSDGYLLLGVVSWGDGCARPNSPGVFTQVSLYRNWINGLL
ncbi:Trypsin-3 [Pseudolycoriella hygida]|uniref:trypsin n=1 Tax=Pseudolycoriella hygida TaxID=35572 RepID=A0A9Q0MNG0_9DIPT|nr:Trypsin-3 [Pseudolycoriella hygida]